MKYRYIPHPHIHARQQQGPVKVADHLPAGSGVARFNKRLAVSITDGVGTMWCAYAFAALALVSLPDAIKGGKSTTVAWVAQTFLQLVLLSIIMVGQKVQSAAADARSEQTYNDAEAILESSKQIQEHLLTQDAELEKQTQTLLAILAKYGPIPSPPGPTA